MGLFKKEDTKTQYIPALDRIIFEELIDDDNRAAELVNRLRSGNPLVLNFMKLDVMACNKLLAFFAGATYALGGKTVEIKENRYLFARTEEFADGTLNEFLNNHK